MKHCSICSRVAPCGNAACDQMRARHRELMAKCRCPSDINFRFWLFVLATGAEVWENNVDYMFWIQNRKYAEASEKAGAVIETNQYGWSTAEQVDEFMAAGIPIPTDEQVAKAHRYFNSMPTNIRETMTSLVSDCVDRTTNIVNRTQLAENTAHALDHDEWLDDPDHIVWDIAIDVGKAHERTLQ